VAAVTVSAILNAYDRDPLVAVIVTFPAPTVAVEDAVTWTVMEDDPGTESGLDWKARLTPERE
jgi:hypothetical protein